MKIQSMLVALTLVNAAGLTALFLQSSQAGASSTDQMLRGRGLEIVDARGQVRASIQLLPASRQADGHMSSETVLLRLITEKGRPAVKISTSEQESGLTLTGPTGTRNSYVQAIAGQRTSLLLARNEDGTERRLTP